MRRTKPVISLAALMGAILGERWLRSQIHQGLEEKRRAETIRSSPKFSTPSYRSASLWSSGSGVTASPRRPKRWSKR